MRTLTFDQFEFDNPSGEEHLTIALASRSNFPFPTPSSFVAACVGIEAAGQLAPAVRFSDHFGYGMIRKYLSHFADLAVPESCLWPCFVLSDGPDEWQIVLEAPDQFIYYCWSTSA